MPGSRGTRSFLTLTSVANVLVGQVYETVPFNALVEIGLIQTVTGMIASVACDSDIVLQDTGETNMTVRATPPLYPDDFLPGFVCIAGSKLFVACRNPTAGTIVLFYDVRLTAL
jgi:hypothetical protein